MLSKALLAFVALTTCGLARGEMPHQKCVSGFCLPELYEKLETPHSDTVNHVNVELDIMDVLNVNDKEFSVTLTMYFTVKWEEQRLMTNMSLGDDVWTPIDLQFLDHLWVPNIFIYNLRSFTALNVLQKLAGVWFLGTDKVYYNQATAITFLCPMRFDFFPLDQHICKFKVGSTNLDMTRMIFAETTFNYDETSRNTILDYHVDIDKLREKDRILEYGELGNFSITGIEIMFTRHKLKYFVVYYLPSGLFVVVSWASFLIPPEVVPGRMAMLITLFLVLINIFNIITSNSPNVEGMTAISAWMIVCIIFVFGALSVYAWLLWKKKKSIWKRKRLRKMTDEETKSRAKKKEEKRSKVDDIFLVAFPLLFLLFNVIYWPKCLSSTPSGDD